MLDANLDERFFFSEKKSEINNGASRDALSIMHRMRTRNTRNIRDLFGYITISSQTRIYITRIYLYRDVSTFATLSAQCYASST